MKYIIIILLFAITAHAQEPREGVKSSYDRFKDVTTINVAPSTVSTLETGSFFLSVFATYPGQKKTDKLEIVFGFISYTENWYFLKSELNLRGIVDEARIDYGKMERVDSQIRRNGVLEIVATKMTVAQIEKIANSKSVEFQVGRLECKLLQTQLADLRYFLTLVK